MKLCSVLNTIYGRDTRPAQWLNLIIAEVWLGVYLCHSSGLIAFSLPLSVADDINAIAGYFTATFLFSVFALMTVGKVHQVAKAFSFALGALANAIITNGYFSAYPPLDMMLFVSLSLSLWFFGAVFYVLSCEGVDGRIVRVY